MGHEHTHTYMPYVLVSLIILVAVIGLAILVYSPQVASGTTEMDSRLKCAKFGQIREDINRIELTDSWTTAKMKTTGQYITDLSLLQLPPGCGWSYTRPCNSTENCQKEIRASLTRCWDDIQREKKTTGTCLLNLEMNNTWTASDTKEELGFDHVCASATKYCGDTEVPRDNIDYSSKPQPKDSLAMEYGLSWWGLGSSKIWVKCTGKCKPP